MPCRGVGHVAGHHLLFMPFATWLGLCARTGRAIPCPDKSAPVSLTRFCMQASNSHSHQATCTVSAHTSKCLERSEAILGKWRGSPIRQKPRVKATRRSLRPNPTALLRPDVPATNPEQNAAPRFSPCIPISVIPDEAGPTKPVATRMRRAVTGSEPPPRAVSWAVGGTARRTVPEHISRRGRHPSRRSTRAREIRYTTGKYTAAGSVRQSRKPSPDR